MKKTLEEKQAEMRERHEQKAKPFEPGVSGNPTGKNAGRPPSPLPLASAPEVRRQLAEMDSQGRTNFALIVATQIAIAKKSKSPNAASRAFDALMDRAFGKATQTVEQKVTFSRDEDLKFLMEYLANVRSSNQSVQ
jgi:hypothetical protein